MATVRVNGRYIDLTVGTVGDLEWKHRWPKGPWEANWKMDLPRNFQHPDLTVDQLVEITVGPVVIWGGVLDRPTFDGDTWSFTAQGYARLAERFLCLTSGGASSSTPSTAWTQAVARGLRWTVPSSGGTSPVAAADATNGLNYLDTLLDAWSDQTGTYWTVSPTGVMTAGLAAPTTPTLHAYPGVGNIGLSDEDVASHLYGRYRSTTTVYSTVETVATPLAGYREEAIDLTDLGVVTGTRAQQTVDGLVAKGRAQPAWTNGLQLAEHELSTAGGAAVSLEFIGIEPEMVRLPGVRNPVTNTLGYLDFVVGETSHRNGSGVIDLTPLGVAQGASLRGAIAAGSPNPALKG